MGGCGSDLQSEIDPSSQTLSQPNACDYNTIKHQNLHNSFEKSKKSYESKIILLSDASSNVETIAIENAAKIAEEKCEWKDALSQLNSEHIIECSNITDAIFALNTKVKQLENENILLKQRIKDLENEKENYHQNIQMELNMNENIFLVYGYSRQNGLYMPSHIIDVVLFYYFGSLTEKDIFKPNDLCIFDSNNLIFTTKGSSDWNVTYAIIEREWCHGKHNIKFKCLQSAQNPISIGLVTHNKRKTSTWLFDSKECEIAYQLYVSHYSSNICHCINGKQQSSQTLKRGEYKTDDTIEMRVDFNENKLIFYINDKKIGGFVAVESNTYYPAIEYGVHNTYGITKIKLLSLF